MPRIKDGDFYINNSNQDFYLRENGVWVRKGNIRDEGSSGLVGVAPILGLGFTLGAQVTRTRFLGSLAEDIGFDMAVVVDRIRDIAPGSHQFGLAMDAILNRVRYLTTPVNCGLSMDVVLSVISSQVESIAADMALGMSLSAALSRSRSIISAKDFGLTLAATLTHSVTQPNVAQAFTPQTVSTVGNDGTASLFPTGVNVPAGTLIILDIARKGTGDIDSSSVTDNFGTLTWTKRSSSANFHSAPSAWYRVERWWAYTSGALSNFKASFVFNRSGNAANATYGCCYGFTGVPKAALGSPFYGATATQTVQNTTTTMSAVVDPRSIAAHVEVAAAVYRDLGLGLSDAGSGMTLLSKMGSNTSNGNMNFSNEYKLSNTTATATQTCAFTNAQQQIELIADVIDGSIP